MSAKSAKRLINWHTGWLGEKDSNGDLVGDWAQFFDKEQFKCRYCDVVRKYSNGGRTSLIQHSDSAKHKTEVNISSYPARILAGLFFFVVQKY